MVKGEFVIVLFCPELEVCQKKIKDKEDSNPFVSTIIHSG